MFQAGWCVGAPSVRGWGPGRTCGSGVAPRACTCRLRAGGWLSQRRGRAARRGGERAREQVNGRSPPGPGSGSPGPREAAVRPEAPGRGQGTPHRAGLPPPPAPASPPEVEVTGGVARAGGTPASLPSLQGAPPCTRCRRRGSAPAHSLRTSARDAGVTETPIERDLSWSSVQPVAPGVCFPFCSARSWGPRSAPPSSHVLPSKRHLGVQAGGNTFPNGEASASHACAPLPHSKEVSADVCTAEGNLGRAVYFGLPLKEWQLYEKLPERVFVFVFFW